MDERGVIMAWIKSRRSTGGFTQGELYSSELGDSTLVKHWGNAPSEYRQSGSDLILQAEWEGGEPWNTWIPLGVEKSTLVLGALTESVWYDVYEFLCDEENNIYVVLQTRRLPNSYPTLPLYEFVLIKRVKGTTNTDTEISIHRNIGIFNDYGHSFSLGSAFFYFGSYTYSGKTFYGAGVCFDDKYEYGGQVNVFTNGLMFTCRSDLFWEKVGTIEPPSEPTSPEYGDPSKPDGGYNPDNPHGTFDFHSDEIPIDPLPTVGVTTTGFINVYKIEQNELQTLGEKLFPHFLPAELLTGSSNLDIKDVLLMFLKAGYGTLYNPAGTAIELNDNLGVFDIIMNGKLIDYVLDCHIIPTSISGGTTAPLKIGYREFNDIILAKATQDYVDVNCGELSIDEAFGNFLDYSCKVEIYLPFVGFVNIPNEYWNNATVGVHYIFNIVDGSFQAKIVSTRRDTKMKLKNTVIGQYGGVCCIHFPITGLSYSNIVSGLVNSSLGIASHAGVGDTMGAATQASKMLSLRPETPMSNGYNASSSFLAQRTPYLVIKYPASQFSELYPTEQGTPLNVPFQLSTLSGFTTIDNPVLNIQCSDEEYNEIVSLLKTGIIL